MVRARGVQVSSAAAPTVLGTAVVRAALLGLLHQSHPGLQKAQSPGPHFVDQADLRLTEIHQPLPPEGCD